MPFRLHWRSSWNGPHRHAAIRSRPTASFSGGSMSRCQVPKRRVLLVMYGVTVARSTGSTSHPSSMRSLATFVIGLGEHRYSGWR